MKLKKLFVLLISAAFLFACNDSASDNEKGTMDKESKNMKEMMEEDTMNMNEGM